MILTNKNLNLKRLELLEDCISQYGQEISDSEISFEEDKEEFNSKLIKVNDLLKSINSSKEFKLH